MRWPLLFAFLVVPLAVAEEKLPPMAMPRDHKDPRPTPRTAKEVEAVLAGSPAPGAKMRPLRMVLVAGKTDHGIGEHDYPAWQKVWAALFKLADRVDVVTAWEWPERAEFQKADIMVFYQHGDWTAARQGDGVLASDEHQCRHSGW